MEYYLVPRRNELSSHEKMWKKFKYILLSERNQPEKATHYVIPPILYSKKKQNDGQ